MNSKNDRSAWWVVLLLIACELLLIQWSLPGHMLVALIATLIWGGYYWIAINPNAFLGFSITPSEWNQTIRGESVKIGDGERTKSAAKKASLIQIVGALSLIFFVNLSANSKKDLEYSNNAIAVAIGVIFGALIGLYLMTYVHRSHQK